MGEVRIIFFALMESRSQFILISRASVAACMIMSSIHAFISSWSLLNSAVSVDCKYAETILSPLIALVDPNEPSGDIDPHASHDWGSNGYCQYPAQISKHTKCLLYWSQVIQIQYFDSGACLLWPKRGLDEGRLSSYFWVKNHCVPNVVLFVMTLFLHDYVLFAAQTRHVGVQKRSWFWWIPLDIFSNLFTRII